MREPKKRQGSVLNETSWRTRETGRRGEPIIVTVNGHGNDFVFYSAVEKDSLIASLWQ